jgi:hypothetical protein
MPDPPVEAARKSIYDGGYARRAELCPQTPVEDTRREAIGAHDDELTRLAPPRALRAPGASIVAATIASGALLLAPGEAAAFDFEVHGNSAVQAYEVASPWGDTILERRRYMQTLGLGLYNLQGKFKPGEAEYSIVLKMRLDVDFGINGHLEGAEEGGETSFDAGGSRYIPGLEQAPLDLMYGFIEGRNLAGGWLGFRVGRQYMTDMLGWWSFDGGLVRITTPYFLQAELYGGLEQRGGMPLSTARFERQGVWRGSHRDFGQAGEPSSTLYPSFQFTKPAPAFGVALESAGPNWVHGRFSYRRVYNTGKAFTQQFPDPSGGFPTADGARVSQDRLGYALDVNKDDLGGLKGGFTYDLYNDLVGSFFGGIEAYLGKPVTVGADIDYFEPTFDADSIWNWFTKSPVMTITGRVAVDFTKEFDIAGSGGVRLWQAEGDPDTFAAGQCEAQYGVGSAEDALCKQGLLGMDPTGNARTFSRAEENRETSTTLDALANLAGRYRFLTGDLSARGMLQTGERGRRAGGDLAGEKRFDGGRYALGARVSLYDWADPLRPDRDATSFGYVVGAGYRPFQYGDLRLEWEHDMNRLVGQRFRVVGMLNLQVGQ